MNMVNIRFHGWPNVISDCEGVFLRFYTSKLFSMSHGKVRDMEKKKSRTQSDGEEYNLNNVV